MAKYREILRLKEMGLSQRSIASSCQCSRNTVSEVLNRATMLELAWPLADNVTEADLQYLLFPERAQTTTRKIPDCEHIHRELARSGVTLSLLWSEYCESCRLSQEISLKYTQYCNYYRKFAATTKATMHIQLIFDSTLVTARVCRSYFALQHKKPLSQRATCLIGSYFAVDFVSRRWIVFAGSGICSSCLTV
ncbi:hypothetical protein [Ferroacidibacillus organovorans]|uniref:hypothetical protein n=1 Tax=Ferroacidibacillus organovorans TaxID=1765683 RepID=UPI00128F5BED|nr:hypothetical protein [Ferroacidibacillus organovorans]